VKEFRHDQKRQNRTFTFINKISPSPEPPPPSSLASAYALRASADKSLAQWSSSPAGAGEDEESATKARMAVGAICLRGFGFSPYYRGLSKTKHSRN
jgi:hypothetical protein